MHEEVMDGARDGCLREDEKKIYGKNSKTELHYY